MNDRENFYKDINKIDTKARKNIIGKTVKSIEDTDFNGNTGDKEYIKINFTDGTFVYCKYYDWMGDAGVYLDLNIDE